MATIYWSHDAIEDFEQNIEFLEKRFSEKQVQSFIDKTQDIINVISASPKAFKQTAYKMIHVVPIVPQISLYYKILNKQTIELVRFWNNYQNPESLSL